MLQIVLELISRKDLLNEVKQLYLKFFHGKNREIKFCNISSILYSVSRFRSWFHVKVVKIKVFHSYFSSNVNVD